MDINQVIKNLCYTKVGDDLESNVWSCDKCQSRHACFLSSLCKTNTGDEFVFVHCKKCDNGWRNFMCDYKEYTGDKWSLA